MTTHQPMPILTFCATNDRYTAERQLDEHDKAKPQHKEAVWQTGVSVYAQHLHNQMQGTDQPVVTHWMRVRAWCEAMQDWLSANDDVEASEVRDAFEQWMQSEELGYNVQQRAQMRNRVIQLGNEYNGTR